MRRMRAAMVVVVCFVACGLAGASPIGYAVGLFGNLYEVDLGGATATLIGPMSLLGAAAPQGLAVSPGGDLYCTDGYGRLYSLNTTTGASTPIGLTGRDYIGGLDFLGNTLIAIDFLSTPTVFSIDTTTADTTNIVTASSSTGSVRAMTVTDANTVLIVAGGPTNTLKALDLSTGNTTTIGSSSVPGFFMPGLDFASDGKLYGLDDVGTVVEINPSTAATTVIGDTGSHHWLGLAAVDVIPEPATLSLLALGGLGLLRRRRRKR